MHIGVLVASEDSFALFYFVGTVITLEEIGGLFLTTHSLKQANG